MRLKNRLKRLEKIIKSRTPKEIVIFNVYPDGSKELLSGASSHGKNSLVVNLTCYAGKSET